MKANLLTIFALALVACGETKTRTKPTAIEGSGRASGSGGVVSDVTDVLKSGSNAATGEVGSATDPSFTPSCDAKHAPKPDRDQSPMCLVPAGSFMMGTPIEADRPEDGPGRRVGIANAFYIDQFEVTNEQYVRFLRAKGSPCTKDNRFCLSDQFQKAIDTKTLVIKPGSERLPVEVTFAGAGAYCAWAGKRLPTEAEWEFAARHDPATGTDRIYPWGDEYKPGVTNAFAVIEPKRGKAAEVGTFKDDRSAIGAYDMGGNEHEWVADCYSLDFNCPGPCDGAAHTTKCEQICTEGAIVRCETARLVKGGSMTSYPAWLKSKVRTSTFSDSTIGIRCVVAK